MEMGLQYCEAFNTCNHPFLFNKYTVADLFRKEDEGVCMLFMDILFSPSG